MAKPTAAPAEPLVSLLMVVRNGAAHIDAALVSARKQTLAAIEIVVVDDRSTDTTPAIIRRHAAEDARVVAVPGHGRGLAAVRNLSITAAAAPFGAVIDSDDILHPRHVERLLALVNGTGADLAAANMIAFGQGQEPALFAPGAEWQRERLIDHERFVRAGRIDRPDVSLGYLKPLFRLDALRGHGLAYDQRLRIGEDWDLIERALAAGLAYAFCPEPTYFYRRHPGSTSFRWRHQDLAGLIAAEHDRPAAVVGSALARAQRERLASLEDALAHVEAVEALKARRFERALAPLLRRPGATRLLARSLREGAGRRAAGLAASWWRRIPARPKPPLALLCGTPAPGSPVALAAAVLAAGGCEVRPLGRTVLADPAATARAGQGAAMVLVAEEALADEAAYAIGDGAPFVAPAGTRHPLIDCTIDSHSLGALLDLVAAGAVRDSGLARSERPVQLSGLAA